MIRLGHETGVSVWRIGPSGTHEVQLVRVYPDRALVCGRGVKKLWALKPMAVHTADLFESRAEAKAEYRRRRGGRTHDLNVTTPLGEGA